MLQRSALIGDSNWRDSDFRILKRCVDTMLPEIATLLYKTDWILQYTLNMQEKDWTSFRP